MNKLSSIFVFAVTLAVPALSIAGPLDQTLRSAPTCDTLIEEADTSAELAALGSALLEADCPDDTSDFAYGCNESGSVCILVLGDGGNCERYCDPYGCTWICT